MKYRIREIIHFFKTKPLIFALVVGLGCYGLIRFLFFIFPVEDLKPDHTWIQTVGTVTKYALGKNGKGYIEYQIGEDRRKELNYLNRYSRVVGEKYVIMVNPKDHSQYVTKTWEPIFLSNEATSVCFGIITRTYRFNWADPDSFRTNHGIEFSYTVNGIEYERDQYLPPEYTGVYKRLNKGDTFRVEYLIENPQRSVMDIKKYDPVLRSVP